MMDKKNDSLELPKGWVWTRLGDIIRKVALTGRKLKQREYQEKGRLPVIDQGHTFIGGYTDKEDLKVCCEPPVIVFGDHTKVVKYVDFDFVAGADGVKALKPLEAFYPKLFYYFVQAIQLPARGYARHFQFLEKSFIPLPPLPEQQRIVAKIEELFTKLDVGVEALKKVKTQLKRYRQAVLKHAFEGKLTEEWREAHKGELEPASVFLEKIKEERRKKTKEGRGKYNVGAYRNKPLQKNLPQLPEGWIWTKLREICLEPQYGWTTSATTEGKLRLLRTTDITSGHIDWDSVPFCKKEPADKEKYLLEDGDIVISRAGSVGYSYLIKNPKETVFASYLIRFRPLVNDQYLAYFLKSPSYWNSISEKSLGIAIPNVNASKLKQVIIPLPPLIEQHKIVEEIEHRLSVADEVEKVVEQSLKQAERLRQSILKKAFEGELVPQDPSDEPAEKLLERIKAKKAKKKTEKKTKKRRERKVYPKQMRLI